MIISNEIKLDVTDLNDKVFFDFSDILNSNIKISNKYKCIRKTTNCSFIEILFPDNTTKQFIIKNYESNNYDCFKNPDNELSIIWCNSNIRNDHAIISILISYFKKKLNNSFDEKFNEIFDSIGEFRFDDKIMLDEDLPESKLNLELNRYQKACENNIEIYRKIFNLYNLHDNLKIQENN